MDVQDIFDIACRHATPMARAMAAACLSWADARGVRLRVPEALRGRPDARGARPDERVDWERMVRCNSDTRWHHC